MDNSFSGHTIRKIGKKYVYTDTNELVADTWINRACGHCGLHNTKEGYDGCIGEVDGAINACCGHGNTSEAYVQYKNNEVYTGNQAQSIFNNKE